MNNMERDCVLRQMLIDGQPIAVFPRGVSMRPLFKQGRTCVGIMPLTGEPQIGDVLAFSRSSDDANVIHRLVSIDGDTYVTRGDNCLNCERLRREQIFGIVNWICTDNNTIYTTDSRYQRYVHFWTKSWPVRKRILQLRMQYYRLRHAAGKIIKGNR